MNLPLSRPKFVNVKNAVPKASSVNAGEVQVGATIRHERFGLGKVIAIAGDPDSRKATVEFENSGVKQLLLKFARFEIVG
jgi:DNA helicase-2/ATP-dependent DNA helicase PcrA